MIPKVVHKIWIGGEVPVQLRRMHARMQELNPEFEFKVWDRKSIGPLLNAKWVEHLRGRSFQTDVMRYELLARNPGFYFDWDVWPFKPLRELVNAEHTDNFFHREGYPSQALNNGIFAIGEGCPIGWALAERLDLSCRLHKDVGGQVQMVGVGYFTRVVDSFKERALILPQGLFYDPLGLGAFDQPPEYLAQRPIHSMHFYNSIVPLTVVDTILAQGKAKLPPDPGMGGLARAALSKA